MGRTKREIEGPRFPRFIVRYIALAVSVLVILGVVNLYKQNDQAAEQRHEIAVTQREADIASCQRGNEIRRVSRATIDTVIGVQIDAIQQEDFRAKSITPDLFPGTPPAELRRLLRQGERDRAANVHDLKAARRLVNKTFHPIDCPEHIPPPAT